MSSAIFYRFKSQKDYSRISFDAAQMGLTVFDVKRDIIQLEKLGTGTDFDLLLSNADSKKEYADDAENIPKGTSVLVQRKPPSRGPGKGSASRYVTNNAVQIISRKEFKRPSSSVGPPTRNEPKFPASNGTEADAIRQMLLASSDHWQATQDRMAMSKPIYRPGNKAMSSGPVPDKPLPQGYVCYRCGLKGHWIQACPTNGDESFENRKKIKRTTGIPRSQLQKVQPSSFEDMDGNVMVNADGESVMFVPDEASWNTYQKSTKSAQQDQSTVDSELVCDLCKKLMKDPHSVPCCQKVFCEECIQSALLESDFVCPSCGTKDILLDRLQVLPDMRERIRVYSQDEANEARASANEKESESLIPPGPSLKRSLEDRTTPERTQGEIVSSSDVQTQSQLGFPPMPQFDPVLMSMMSGFPPLGYPLMPFQSYGIPSMVPPMPPPKPSATTVPTKHQAKYELCGQEAPNGNK